jgi:hypothetical protein
MKKTPLLFVVLTLLALSALSQRTSPADEKELAAITQRGRALAEYDVAAWHSTDAVMLLSPKDGSITGFIGRKVGDKWTVVYGRLNPAGDKYLIVYEAIQQSSPKEFKVKFHEKPKEDADYFLRAARALDAAKVLFVPAEERPYNAAVLPEGNDRFYVYMVPAQLELGIFPIGGDVRFLVSREGRVVETRQLHKSIIEFQVPKGVTPQSGYHTAILDEVPEDTCVFHVLAREPKVPELVVTPKYVYRIMPDGSIVYMMPTEAFKKIGKN